MRTVAAVLALVACVHAGLWALLRTKETAPDFIGQLASVSYAPFVNSSHPDSGERPTEEQIRADLKAIAPYTKAIRTYSSTGGAELVPPIAAEFGLKVTVGAWIDKNQDRNEREIRSALDLARRYSNVNAIVVGNETMLRQRDQRRRPHQADPTGEAIEPGPCHDGRRLGRLDRCIQSSLRRWISSPRTSCLTGPASTPRKWSTAPSSTTTICAGSIPASGS